MAFTSIVIIVGVVFAFYYTGMFIHDLFIKKDPAEFMPKPKDVDIDISDEAGLFKPIAVEKSEPKQQTTAALNSSVPKSDEEIGTEHPIADGESRGKSDVEQSAPPPPSATPFGSDDAKSDGKTSEDFGPRPTDAETQKRINELVKLRRGEMLTDEMTASKDDSPSASENAKEDEANPSTRDVRIIGPEHTVSPNVSDAAGKEFPKEKTPSGANFKEATPPTPAPAKKSRPAKPPKPPKQPEFHSDAYFDILKVQIDDTKQHTKLQGAQTAEQVSKEAKRVSPDDAQMALRQINSLWEKKESERVPDEDERQAIEKSERSNREAPPEFNI